jgi:hypothetical protein
MPKWIAAVLLAGAAAASLAQTSSETAQRGSILPGESRDESRPAEGAIQGGSIEEDIGATRTPGRDIARCKQLTGELREQCLRDLGAGAGGSRPPAPAPPKQEAPAAPPPQNPRQPR